MSLTYAYARLERSIEALGGAGDIKDRLDSAAHTLTPVFAGDFPGEPMAGEFEEIYEALTWVPGTQQRWSGQTTLEAMTEEEAADLARRLFSLYLAVSRMMPRP